MLELFSVLKMKLGLLVEKEFVLLWLDEKFSENFQKDFTSLRNALISVAVKSSINSCDASTKKSRKLHKMKEKALMRDDTKNSLNGRMNRD